MISHESEHASNEYGKSRVQDSLDGFKALGKLVLGAVAGLVVYTYVDGMTSTTNSDTCDQLRAVASANGQSTEQLSFTAENGAQVNCF